MPSSHAILADAIAIGIEWRTVAAAWHVSLAVVLTAVLCGWRPSNRVAAYLLDSAGWPVTLAAAGLVYGAVGVFVLGVQLDYVLVAGTLVLVGALAAFTSPLRSAHTTSMVNRSNATAGGMS